MRRVQKLHALGFRKNHLHQPTFASSPTPGSPCGVVAYWSRRTLGTRTVRPTVWTVLLAGLVLTATILFLR